MHRSITFWLGLFTMIFIGWAWWDSMHWQSGFRWHRASGGNAAGSFGLSHCIDRHGLSGVPPSSPGGERDQLTLVEGGKPAFPGPLFLRGGNMELPTTLENITENRPKTYSDYHKLWMSYQAPGDWLILIPHWLTLLGVTIVWCGLLVWRAKRRKRAGERSKNLPSPVSQKTRANP